MGALFSRMLWFFVVASILSYATFLIVGDITQVQASGKNEPTIIRDRLGVGAHHLSGMIMVPTLCNQLSVRIEEVTDTTFALIFRTWYEPSVEDCLDDETPRHFGVVLFAPSTGIDFIATLDGAPFPIKVLPTIPEKIVLE